MEEEEENDTFTLKKNGMVTTSAITIDQLTVDHFYTSDIMVVLGVAASVEEDKLDTVLTSWKDTTNAENSQRPRNKLQALLCDPTCGSTTQTQQFVGTYRVSHSHNNWDPIIAQLAPWSQLASHQRLFDKTQSLFKRKSSEDYVFALLFEEAGNTSRHNEIFSVVWNGET